MDYGLYMFITIVHHVHDFSEIYLFENKPYI